MKKIVIKKGEGNALTIVDMQNDFAREDGALYVRGILGEPVAEKLIGNVLKLGRMDFGRFVFTKDAHPDGHIEFGIFGAHCLENTPGQNICEALRELLYKASEILYKGRDRDLIGYSIESSIMFGEHIAKMRKRGVRRVFVCGLAYDYCAGESAIAYAKQGFETYVIRDATRSVDLPAGNAKKMDKKLRLYGVRTIFMKDITE